MELYLIIQCGYEGIEKLFFPTHSAQEAVDKIAERRRKIIDMRKKREEIIEKFGDESKENNFQDEWFNMMKRKEITRDEHHMGRFEEPDAYCIQKWDEENNEFKCVCKELNVEGGPSETWWM